MASDLIQLRAGNVYRLLLLLCTVPLSTCGRDPQACRAMFCAGKQVVSADRPALPPDCFFDGDSSSDTNGNAFFDSGHYVFDMQRSCDGRSCIASSSDRCISSFSLHSFTLSRRFAPHADRITGIESSSVQPSVFYSSSADGSISVWDDRSGPLPVTRLQCGEAVESLAVGVNDRVFAAALGSSINFYDLRTPASSGLKEKPLGAYSDCHTDTITKIRFKSTDSTVLASAGEDGLICIFDSATVGSDDAVVAIMNTECPVRHFGFFGGGLEGVYCLSATEIPSFWHYPTGIRLGAFPSIREDWRVDYLVDCFAVDADHLSLLCGRYDGSAVALAVQPSELRPLFELPSNGHIASIRCANYSSADQVLLTGGEDNFACKWMRQSQADTACSSSIAKSSVKSSSHKGTSKDSKSLRRDAPY